MQKIFNHLLIPVSTCDLDRKAVEKAAAFANQMGCHLHIICMPPETLIQRKPFNIFKGTSRSELIRQVQNLDHLENSCRQLMGNGLKLRIIFREKSPVSALRQYQEAHN